MVELLTGKAAIMIVKDFMTKRVQTLRPNTDYREALQLMEKHRCHHLPVLDAKERLVGIVAERDLLLAAARYLNASADVGDIMHQGVFTTTPDTLLTQAALVMTREKVGGLPVVSGDAVVGIITETDIFRAFAEAVGAGHSIAPPAHMVAKKVLTVRKAPAGAARKATKKPARKAARR